MFIFNNMSYIIYLSLSIYIYIYIYTCVYIYICHIYMIDCPSTKSGPGAPNARRRALYGIVSLLRLSLLSPVGRPSYVFVVGFLFCSTRSSGISPEFDQNFTGTSPMCVYIYIYIHIGIYILEIYT